MQLHSFYLLLQWLSNCNRLLHLLAQPLVEVDHVRAASLTCAPVSAVVRAVDA